MFWVQLLNCKKCVNLMHHDDENLFERVFLVQVVHVAFSKEKGYGSNQIVLEQWVILLFDQCALGRQSKGKKEVSYGHGQGIGEGFRWF